MGRRQIGQALLRYLREYQGLPADAPWGTMVGVRPTKLLHKYIDTYGSVTQQLVTLGTSFLSLWKSLRPWGPSVSINVHFS